MLLRRLLGLFALWSVLALFVSRTTGGNLGAFVHLPMLLLVLAVPFLVASIAHGPSACAAALVDALGSEGDLPGERRRASTAVLRTLGGVSVAMGVVAVLLGMIGVLHGIAVSSGQASTSEMAFGVAALMVAPLYGVGVRAFLWDPLADAVEGSGEDVGAELELAE